MDLKKMREKADAAPQGGAGRYLRVESGEKVVIVLVGETDGRVIVWDDSTSRPACRDDLAHPSEVKTKILQEVFVPAEGRRSIWECGLQLWRQADKLRQKLPRWSLELSRSGAGMSTRWDVAPGEELTDQQVSAIKASQSLAPLLGPDDTSIDTWDAWLAERRAPVTPPVSQSRPPDDEIPF